MLGFERPEPAYYQFFETKRSFLASNGLQDPIDKKMHDLLKDIIEFLKRLRGFNAENSLARAEIFKLEIGTEMDDICAKLIELKRERLGEAQNILILFEIAVKESLGG